MVLVVHKQFLRVLKESHHLIRGWIQWFLRNDGKEKRLKETLRSNSVCVICCNITKVLMSLSWDRVHAKLRGDFLGGHLQWPSHCSGRCHSHCVVFRVSVSTGKKVVTRGSSACFVRSVAQDFGHRKVAQSHGNFHFQLYCSGWDKFSWLK